ncbi:MAG: N-acetylgalactosamine 6-sulfate sulfatase [Verrucomicrobiales bacterium]|nr:N-acetylgalactosamine 6-sulfate sulfatase [Verrucomicrobiales bacterium]
MRTLFLTVGLIVTALSSQAAKPNIVMILVDDLGYSDLSSFGGTDIQTPAIDTLMNSGLRFDQFYSNCTVCTPTRASLLTGRYPDIVGAPGVIRQWDKDSWGYFKPTGPTLPELMRKAGYHTGMVGKWHLGFESPNIPNDRGFDFFHGFLADMMDDYWTHLRGGVNWMRLNKEEVKPKGHATEVFTRWAIDYIKEQTADKKQPFFLYLAYNAPHFPIQPPKDWLEKVQKREPQLNKKRATNVAFVEHMDHEIGKFLDAVNELGIAKDTLIVFSSDNGGSIPHGALNGKLRGGKQDHWEGGIRVPTCAVWPGTIPVGRTSALGITMDLLPTFCEIAGANVKHKIDGQSLANVLLKGGKGDPRRTLVFVRREGNRRYQGRAYYAIRKGPWKLLQNNPFEPMKLVNLEKDPAEEKPLPLNSKIANELTRTLMDHIQKAGATPWRKPNR